MFRLKKKDDIIETDSAENSQRWLIAGLGNPGTRYSRTWHNAGFMCIDMLSQKHNIPVDRIKFKGLYGQGQVEGSKVILLKPATFMNNSGESIREATDFFKIPHSRILVIFDDIDIGFGSIRIRKSGGPGTHNGMKSVIEHLGTENFPRVRIGIGPAPERLDLAAFVLSEIPSDKRAGLFENLERVCESVGDIIRDA